MRRSMLFALLAAAPATAAGPSLQPGLWEITTTVDSMEMADAPPGLAAMMKSRPIKLSHCLTAQEAARGPQDMMKGNKACQFTRYSMAGGRLSSEMVCRQGRDTTTATATGSFTPTSFTTTGRTVTSGSDGMTMTATTVGRRVGNCK